MTGTPSAGGHRRGTLDRSRVDRVLAPHTEVEPHANCHSGAEQMLLQTAPMRSILEADTRPQLLALPSPSASPRYRAPPLYGLRRPLRAVAMIDSGEVDCQRESTRCFRRRSPWPRRSNSIVSS